MGKKILAMLLAAALAVAFAVPSAAVSGKVAGGADGTVKTVDTRQTIDTADITYQNMRVENNLTISEEVGRGTVTLKNVEITGTLLIRSGGTVVLDGVTCPNVTIQNPKYKPTVIATGSTSIDTTYLKGNCVIEERGPVGGRGRLHRRDLQPQRQLRADQRVARADDQGRQRAGFRQELCRQLERFRRRFGRLLHLTVRGRQRGRPGRKQRLTAKIPRFGGGFLPS